MVLCGFVDVNGDLLVLMMMVLLEMLMFESMVCEVVGYALERVDG